MSIHNKFNFDDPQDSYWNENGSNSSFFDDNTSKQARAQIELDDLFSTDDGPTFRYLQPPPTVPAAEPVTPNIGVQFCSTKDDARKSFGDGRTFPEMNPRARSENAFRKETSAVSAALSECSVSSMPSEAQQLDLDYSRLRTEHRKLQRQYEKLRAERYYAADVNETMGRILQCEPVSLDLYKSKKEKLALLNAAISSCDNNAILKIVLFLHRTLQPAVFREMLLDKPKAAEQYLSHLRSSGQLDECATTLFALGRLREAALVEFAIAMRAKTVTQKVSQLKKLLTSSFMDPSLAFERDEIIRFIKLSERQIQIEATDSSDKSKKFIEFPRNASLVGQPPIHTLYYASLYHFDDPLVSSASPQNIKELCAFTEPQFTYTTVGALVRQNRWPDIERILIPRGLLGAITKATAQTIKQTDLPIQCLLDLLHVDNAQPPKDLLCRILRAHSDINERMKLAEKYSATEVVIECALQQKDRKRLEAYAGKLVQHSPDHYKVFAALNSAKWK